MPQGFFFFPREEGRSYVCFPEISQDLGMGFIARISFFFDIIPSVVGGFVSQVKCRIFQKILLVDLFFVI